jgi:hypothetical protein
MNKKRDDNKVETGGATEREREGERERECQIRSQHKRSSLTIFSPKPPSLPGIYSLYSLFFQIFMIIV